MEYQNVNLSKDTKPIVVVIPTFGRDSLLERTLQSLSSCTLPENYNKTLVIENGPKGNAEKVCAKFSSIRCEYQYSEIANKSAALNKGLKNIDKDTFIIFLDDDIRASRGLIKSYAKYFHKYGENFIYGGPMGVDYEREPEEYYKSYLPISAKGWKLEEGKQLKVENFIGFNWAVLKGKIDLTQGFDERFGPNSTTGAVGQEHQMMFQLVEKGLDKKYVEEAWVYHYVPKERSGFRWALNRKYKGGISVSLLGKKNNLDHINFKKEFLMGSFNLLKSICKFSREGFTFYLFKLYHLAGIYKGLEIKKNKE